MTFQRIGAMMYLTPFYAPGNQPGSYMVETQCVSHVNGHDCVVAHIIRIGDKLFRVWPN